MVGYFKCFESCFDYFGVGYVFISIFVGLGMVLVWDVKGEDFKVVFIIGDGVLIGGMVLEVINYVGYLFYIRLMVIFNDNEMFIFFNVGVIFCYLNKVCFSSLM